MITPIKEGQKVGSIIILRDEYTNKEVDQFAKNILIFQLKKELKLLNTFL